MRVQPRNGLALLFALAVLLAVGCSESPTATPNPTATPQPTATTPTPTPAPTPTPTPPPSVVEQLRMNAAEFEYAIGTHGGSITSATISEPLTFNLAISTDSSSSDVLGYLFEGLTETSWLTDQVEPALAESWERSDDGLTWTFHLRRDVTWHGRAALHRPRRGLHLQPHHLQLRHPGQQPRVIPLPLP